MSINPVTNPDDLYGLMAPDALLKHLKSIVKTHLPRAGIGLEKDGLLFIQTLEERILEHNSIHNKPAFEKAHAALTDVA